MVINLVKIKPIFIKITWSIVCLCDVLVVVFFLVMVLYFDEGGVGVDVGVGVVVGVSGVGDNLCWWLCLL